MNKSKEDEGEDKVTEITPRPLLPYTNESIFTYMVKEVKTIDTKDQPEEKLSGTLFDLEAANHVAMARFRYIIADAAFPRTAEAQMTYHENRFQALITFDTKNHIQIMIDRYTMPTDFSKAFSPSILSTLANTIYMCFLTEIRTTTDATGREILSETKVPIIHHGFTERKAANRAAVDNLLQTIKPIDGKHSSIEAFKYHVAEIEDLLAGIDKEDDLVDLEISIDAESCWWMDSSYKSVKYQVEKIILKGPLN